MQRLIPNTQGKHEVKGGPTVAFTLLYFADVRGIFA